MAKRSRKTGPDPIDAYVGSRVRGRRTGLRMSQSKLGEVVGVTFQQIQKYENGANRIGASNLYKIAKALGVDVKFLYEGMPEEFPAKGSAGGLSEDSVSFDQDPMNSRDAIEIVHNYFRIESTNVRKRLSLFIKSLAEAEQTGDDR